MEKKLKNSFKVGQRVKFCRSHDKAVELTGKIVRIHPGHDDCVDVETIPDGHLVEVAGIETVHAADVERFDKVRELIPLRDESPGEERRREAAEQAEEDAEDRQPKSA